VCRNLFFSAIFWQNSLISSRRNLVLISAALTESYRFREQSAQISTTPIHVVSCAPLAMPPVPPPCPVLLLPALHLPCAPPASRETAGAGTCASGSKTCSDPFAAASTCPPRPSVAARLARLASKSCARCNRCRTCSCPLRIWSDMPSRPPPPAVPPDATRPPPAFEPLNTPRASLPPLPRRALPPPPPPPPPPSPPARHARVPLPRHERHRHHHGLPPAPVSGRGSRAESE